MSAPELAAHMGEAVTGPCPAPRGTPPPAAWAPGGAPPAGLEFLGTVATTQGFLMPCPVHLMGCPGWVAVAPDETRFGYRVAHELGCSAGCNTAEVTFYHLLGTSELPPRPPVQADEMARRYVFGALRKASRRVLEDADPTGRLKRESYQLAGLARRCGVDPAEIGPPLAVVAREAGMDAGVLQEISRLIAAGSVRAAR